MLFYIRCYTVEIICAVLKVVWVNARHRRYVVKGKNKPQIVSFGIIHIAFYLINTYSSLHLLNVEQIVVIWEGVVAYVGKATVGAVTNAAVWKVFKMTTEGDGDLKIEYADGDAAFDNVWDNRASLSYS